MENNSVKVNMTATPLYHHENVNKCVYNQFSAPPAPQQVGTVINNTEILKNPGENANFYCSHCTLSFEDVIEYDHHNLEMHPGHKKLFTCTVCTTTFRRQDHLKRHMQSLHMNQKFCTCPVCGKDCKRQDILLKHINRKHTTAAEVFHCRDCEYTCQSLTELEKHEFTHMASLTDRHLCPHCQSTFKRRDHMLRHVKSQHLNQSIMCPVCNQRYKRRDHVVRHVREKHKMGYLNGKLLTSSDMV